METNKLGLTLQNYKCRKCGQLHAGSYVKNRIMKRCRICMTPFENFINIFPKK